MAVETTAETIRRIMHARWRWSLANVETSEIRTRYAVIDPILRSLGWDIENPAECRLERRIGRTDKRVDYSLCVPRKGNGGLPVARALLEAKQWEHALSYGDYMQMRDYLESVPLFKGIGILTNGREWRLFELQDGTNRAIWTDAIRIQREDFDKAASVLERWLSRSNWA